MASFSKEYCDIVGWSSYDFSYITLFNNLSEGEYFAEICEGLGTYGIHKRSGIPFLVISNDGHLAELSSFLKMTNRGQTEIDVEGLKLVISNRSLTLDSILTID